MIHFNAHGLLPQITELSLLAPVLNADPMAITETWLSSVWTKLSVGDKIIILGYIYRSPSSAIMSFDEARETTMLNIKPGQEVLLVGDFNATSPN